MEEMPSEKKQSESGSINCAPSSSSSQDIPNSLVNKDEDLAIGVVTELKKEGTPIEQKEETASTANDLKEDCTSTQLKEDLLFHSTRLGSSSSSRIIHG